LSVERTVRSSSGAGACRTRTNRASARAHGPWRRDGCPPEAGRKQADHAGSSIERAAASRWRPIHCRHVRQERHGDDTGNVPRRALSKSVVRAPCAIATGPTMSMS
jgi:hypothetical protein